MKSCGGVDDDPVELGHAFPSLDPEVRPWSEIHEIDVAMSRHAGRLRLLLGQKMDASLALFLGQLGFDCVLQINTTEATRNRKSVASVPVWLNGNG